MKKLIAPYCFLLLLALSTGCGTQKEFTLDATEYENYPDTRKKFVERPMGAGKCFQKAYWEGEAYWFEILCPNDLDSKLISDIQDALTIRGYSIDQRELDRNKLGDSTKEAIKDYQNKYGHPTILDPTLIYNLMQVN